MCSFHTRLIWGPKGGRGVQIFLKFNIYFKSLVRAICRVVALLYTVFKKNPHCQDSLKSGVLEDHVECLLEVHFL